MRISPLLNQTIVPQNSPISPKKKYTPQCLTQFFSNFTPYTATKNFFLSGAYPNFRNTMATALCLAIVCGACPIQAAEEKTSKFAKIASLNEIAPCQPPQTIYFFDIDDTLMDAPTMLGSRAWRQYIREATKSDTSQNWHDVFTLFLAKNCPVVPVESITAQYIKNLQSKGYAVYGLTARERNKWYDTPVDNIDKLTTHQLASIGIHLKNDSSLKAFPYFAKQQEYYGGTFFADLELKGEYLRKVFQNQSSLPKKIVFVDDKLGHVQSVIAVLNEFGIKNEGYWYTATEEKNRRFDPLIANIQLYHLLISKGKLSISDEDAVAYAQKFPYKNADDYLNLLMEVARGELHEVPVR